MSFSSPGIIFPYLAHRRLKMRFSKNIAFSSDFTTFLIDFNDIMKQMSMQVDEKSKYRQIMLGGSQA